MVVYIIHSFKGTETALGSAVLTYTTVKNCQTNIYFAKTGSSFKRIYEKFKVSYCENR